MRAGLYARVSSEEQKRGWSIDAQLEDCRDYATSHGWLVAAEYQDVHSAYREGSDDVSLQRPSAAGGEYALVGEWGLVRPNLYQLLRDAEDGLINVVIVWKADRLSRKSGAQDLARDFLYKLGVRFISLEDGLDIEANGRRDVARERNISTQSQAESEKISRRVKRAKRQRAAAGLWNASTTPYGYKRKKINQKGEEVTGNEADKPEAGKYILLPPEKDTETEPAVILAFEAYATGQHSDTTIAGMLNRKGYPPSGRARSGRWTREGVRYLLTNPFYAGKVRYHKNLHDGEHKDKAIISQELFDAVQAVRARRRPPRSATHGQRGAAGRNADRVYLLGRLARCSICGLRLLSQTSGGNGRRGTPTQYYQCPARRRSVDCEVGGKYTTAEDVDAEIGDLVMRLQLPDDWRDRLAELAEHREEEENIEGRRKTLQEAIRNLRKQHKWGDISDSKYLRERDELKAELDALRPAERPAIEAAGETLEGLAEAWAAAPERLRAQMLKTIFEEVRVDVARRRVLCVKPFPPFVPLFRMDGLSEKEGCFYVECEEDQEARCEG